jgi:hypothetical protein
VVQNSIVEDTLVGAYHAKYDECTLKHITGPLTVQNTTRVIQSVVSAGDVSSRVMKQVKFFAGDITRDTPIVIVAFKNHDNGMDGDSAVFGVLTESPIKCNKSQVTDYEVNNEKFQTVISKGEMYVKVRIFTPRDSEHEYHLPKKTKVQNFPLLSIINPPSWTVYNRENYIECTKRTVSITNSTKVIIIYKIEKSSIEWIEKKIEDGFEFEAEEENNNEVEGGNNNEEIAQANQEVDH